MFTLVSGKLKSYSGFLPQVTESIHQQHFTIIADHQPALFSNLCRWVSAEVILIRIITVRWGRWVCIRNLVAAPCTLHFEHKEKVCLRNFPHLSFSVEMSYLLIFYILSKQDNKLVVFGSYKRSVQVRDTYILFHLEAAHQQWLHRFAYSMWVFGAVSLPYNQSETRGKQHAYGDQILILTELHYKASQNLEVLEYIWDKLP